MSGSPAGIAESPESGVGVAITTSPSQKITHLGSARRSSSIPEAVTFVPFSHRIRRQLICLRCLTAPSSIGVKVRFSAVGSGAGEVLEPLGGEVGAVSQTQVLESVDPAEVRQPFIAERQSRNIELSKLLQRRQMLQPAVGYQLASREPKRLELPEVGKPLNSRVG